jgi:hypothetical protein
LRAIINHLNKNKVMRTLENLKKSEMLALLTEIDDQLRNAVENSKKTGERLNPESLHERLCYEKGSLEGTIEWLIRAIDLVKG